MRNIKSLPPKQKTAITIAKLFAESFVEVFRELAQTISVSPSMHFIEGAQTAHRVCSMLDFSGSINGFMILNYPEDAAIDMVSSYQQAMGIPPEDCPNSIGTEVQDTLGELLNQVSGKFRKNLEKIYDIKTKSYTPITMIVNNSLVLKPGDAGHKYIYVRCQLNTPRNNAFYIEFCLQEIVFVLTDDIVTDERSTSQMLEDARPGASGNNSDPTAKEEPVGNSDQEDTDDLLKNLFG